MRSSLSSRDRAAVEQLEQRHCNENLHTRQVARLALALFDAIAARFDLTEEERRLLELAARLHDIGYARAPLDHVRAGARIAQRAALHGLTPASRRELAAIILLHAGRDGHAALAAPDFPLRPPPSRVLRLGALLRVADGLDNGHVQDATIESIRLKRRGIRLRVRAPHWPRSVKTAGRKADLWTSAFGQPLSISRSPRGRTGRLVTKKTPAREALRRLLSLAYRGAVACNEQAAAGDAEALHEMRTALRRCRALLRAFRDAAPAAALRRADEALASTSRALGRARDLDVWTELLPIRSPWRMRLADERRREQPAIEAALAGPRWDDLRRAMGLLLRVGLSQPLPAGEAAPMARAALRHAAHKARKIRMAEGPAAESAHALRQALRRIVLTADVLTSLLGKRTRRRAARLRKATRALGAWHDAAALAAWLRQIGAPNAVVRRAGQAVDASWDRAGALLKGRTEKLLRRLG